MQYLVGARDEQGNWRVSADEVKRFVVQRSIPRSVPAYDLAVRAPKSVSILQCALTEHRLRDSKGTASSRQRYGLRVRDLLERIDRWCVVHIIGQVGPHDGAGVSVEEVRRALG